MNEKKIIIGTRGSDLALKQAVIVREAIKKHNPQYDIEIRIIKTEGDINQSPIPLDTEGKGWFTKEIEQELLAGTIDVAAHSLKDLPEVLPPGLQISSYLEREDPRDVLISTGNKKLDALKTDAIIGTDSIRRKLQIFALRSDVRVESARGNVPTRLKKLDAGEYDALVLAAAGIKRLGLGDRITQYFESSEMMSAPGQGIIAIETRTKDAELNAFMQTITNREATASAVAERAFSYAMGGGCKSPVGACSSIQGDQLTLKGMFAGDDGHIHYGMIEGPISDAQLLGERLAKQIAH